MPVYAVFLILGKTFSYMGITYGHRIFVSCAISRMTDPSTSDYEK
jgi:hypothetical protein